MNDTERKDGGAPGKRRSWREWQLLFLTGFLSLLAIALPLEFVARRLYTESSAVSRPCLIMNDPSTGVRGAPNSSCSEKSFESEWVEYRLNGCGHRTDLECGPKAPGTFRIVMIGSSLNEGFTVSRDQSYAAIIPLILSNALGRKIELYNEAMAWGTPHSVALRFADVMRVQPDLVLYPVTPWDIDNVSITVPPPLTNSQTPTDDISVSPWGRVKAELSRKRNLVAFLSVHSRAFFMLQHFLYKSDSIYLAHSLTSTDTYTPSLQANPSQAWADKLQEFGSYVSEMSAHARSAGVTFVITALPRHAQAVMIAANIVRPGLDPYSFGEQIRSTAVMNGALYVDVLHRFREVPNVNSAFYPVDQHLTIEGQAMFARVIANTLMQGAIPALASPGHPTSIDGPR